MSKEADATLLVDDVIRAAAHLEPELEEALAEHGLTRPSYLVLTALLAAPEQRLSQRDLMASVRRTSGTLSVRLARRDRDPHDARPRARRGRPAGLRRHGGPARRRPARRRPRRLRRAPEPLAG